MKGIKFPVLFTTVYLLVYAILARTDIPYAFIYTLFIISPFFVLWMVYCVLRFGEESKKEFDDGHWYEDLDYKAGPE